MMPVFSRAGVSRINASAVERDVLIIIDPQVDFCPGGALAVRGGDEIVPTVNQLARDFPHIVLTRDWHPPGTTFSSAPTLAGFKTIEVDYGAPTLWPDHCVQGTKQTPAKAALILLQCDGGRSPNDVLSKVFENSAQRPSTRDPS
jgi:nicotinamidase/pyrazinamidase